MHLSLERNREDQIASFIFWIFLLIHLCAWTFLPFLVRYTLPMDSMEGYVWGQQFEWGYDKNPFMNGWLTAFAVKLGGDSGWMIYFFSQLSVALSFWAIFRLGRQFLPAFYALLGVLLLEGVQYYNFHAIDFNDNTLELGLWALLILCFYKALRSAGAQARLLAWLGCGLFAGLSLMTKYYAIVLFAPMLLFLLMFPENRACFKEPGFYLAFFIATVIVTPHFLWLFSHDFVTVSYAFDRVSSTRTFWNHLTYPWQFFYEQLQAFLPAILLAFILLIGKKPIRLSQALTLSRFDKTFLIVIGLGPLFCTALLSLIFGFKLRAGWGEPLFSLGGVLLMVTLQPRLTKARLSAFLGLLSVLLSLALAGYTLALTQGREASSANFPGAAIAKTLTQDWRQTYHQPLHYVAGSRWISGNLAFYSSDHPRVYIQWDPRLSPWINEAQLQDRGAIFLWEKKESIPSDLAKRFPRLRPVKTLRLNWLRNQSLAPIEVNVAYLPPRSFAKPDGIAKARNQSLPQS